MPQQNTPDQTLTSRLAEAALDALNSLREVLAFARKASPDQPLPKALNQARIAAGNILRMACRFLAPATTPSAASSTRSALAKALRGDDSELTALTDQLIASARAINPLAAATPALAAPPKPGFTPSPRRAPASILSRSGI